ASRRRHTSFSRDWSSDVCSSDLRRCSFLMQCGTRSCSHPCRILADSLAVPVLRARLVRARRPCGGRCRVVRARKLNATAAFPRKQDAAIPTDGVSELVEAVDEPGRLSEVLRAWAEAIREDTPASVDAERAERNTAKAGLRERASQMLLERYAAEGLRQAILRAYAIRADGVLAGYVLAQVYTDGDEVVVEGEPLPGE